jgi:hypothetical protein
MPQLRGNEPILGLNISMCGKSNFATSKILSFKSD